MLLLLSESRHVFRQLQVVKGARQIVTTGFLEGKPAPTVKVKFQRPFVGDCTGGDCL